MRSRTARIAGPPAPSFALATFLVLVACDAEPVFTEAEPGQPLPNLTESQLDAFVRGRDLFNRPFTAEQGLGPLFNQDRCGSCHDLPTSGGHGAEPVLKFTRYDPVHGCSTLPEHGGDLQQARVTDAARAAGLTLEVVPATATAISEVRAPPLYGLGLVARIAEAEILAFADPDDRDGDGISGRASRVGHRAPDGDPMQRGDLTPDGDPMQRGDPTVPPPVGRFGHKAQHASLESFSAEALLLEMGITNPAHPTETQPNGQPLPAGVDPAPDPEATREQVRLLVDYIDLLAPPARLLPDDPDQRADIDEGERIFAFLGCDLCHKPFYTLPRDNPDPAFSGLRFRLYSDLLLHDLGPDLADNCTPGAAPSEWKTARLVGLGHRSEFLHNGRAQRIADAIELHGGEATASRDLFRRLTPDARGQLLAFLRSL